MKEFKFKYRTSLASEGQAYNDVKKVLEGVKIERKKMFQILLAVSEAFTNAMVHGNQFNPGKQVFINMTVNSTTITADIIDEGVGFVPGGDSGQFDDLQAESGRGMGLMKKAAERFEMKKSPVTGGTVISMTFAIAPVPANLK